MHAASIATVTAHQTFGLAACPIRVIESLPLGDGRCATLRPLLPRDEALMEAFVDGLPPLARRRAFAATGEAPDAAELVRVDYARQMALVATVVEGEGGEARERIVAHARYVVDGDSARVGVVVADGWAGRGLARRLLAMLCHGAHRAGLRWMHAEVPADDARLMRLVARSGFAIGPRRRGAAHRPARRSVLTLQTPRTAAGASGGWLRALGSWMQLA